MGDLWGPLVALVCVVLAVALMAPEQGPGTGPDREPPDEPVLWFGPDPDHSPVFPHLDPTTLLDRERQLIAEPMLGGDPQWWPIIDHLNHPDD